MEEKKTYLYPAGFARADKVVFAVIRGISYLSAAGLVGIMLVAFFNVLGEKLFKHGIPMSTELVQYLHIPVVFLGVAYVTLDHGHTRIDLLSSHFPQKVQDFFMILGNLLGAFICGFVSYRGFLQMAKFFSRNRMSSVSGVGFPLWPYAFILAFGFALFAFSFVWSIARQLVRKEAPPEAEALMDTAPEQKENGGEA